MPDNPRDEDDHEPLDPALVARAKALRREIEGLAKGGPKGPPTPRELTDRAAAEAAAEAQRKRDAGEE